MVHVVPWRLRDVVNLTSVDAPPDVDELALAGLTPVPSLRVRPPRVAESPAALECRVLEVRSFGESPRAGHVVFAEVLHIAVDPAVVAQDGLPDPVLMGNATRADRTHWFALGARESIARPRWADYAGTDGPRAGGRTAT